MLVAGQEPVPRLGRMPVVMTVALVIALLALGILLLFMLFRSVCASPLLLSVRHPAPCTAMECPLDPEVKQGGRHGCYMGNSLSSVSLLLVYGPDLLFCRQKYNSSKASENSSTIPLRRHRGGTVCAEALHALSGQAVC